MKRALIGASVAAALFLADAQPSDASLVLTVSDGINTQTVSDPGGSGSNSFNDAIGIFGLNVTTGLSKPIVGTALDPILDLNSINLANRDTAGGILSIILTDTDFVGTGGTALFVSSIGGTLSAGSSISVSAFLDCGNTPFSQTTSLTSQSFGAGPVLDNQNASVSACIGSYSLTQVTILELPGGGFYSGDWTLKLAAREPPSRVPEPAVLALFSLGLAGVGFIGRRRVV